MWVQELPGGVGDRQPGDLPRGPPVQDQCQACVCLLPAGHFVVLYTAAGFGFCNKKAQGAVPGALARPSAAQLLAAVVQVCGVEGRLGLHAER